jgi:hypothetical protein
LRCIPTIADRGIIADHAKQEVENRRLKRRLQGRAYGVVSTVAREDAGQARKAARASVDAEIALCGIPALVLHELVFVT